MRRLNRPALSKKTVRTLARSTAKVAQAHDPKQDAETRWGRKPKVAFKEVRSSLEEMASGRSRCMYCEDSLGTDIDHFKPKADYPHEAFNWENYLLACSYCNSNLKRTQFPLDANGGALLIDPTVEDPRIHLLLLPANGNFMALSPKGDASIRVFGLNDTSFPRRLPKGRKDALVSLVALLKDYDSEINTNPAKAEEIKVAVQDFPFSVVLTSLIDIAGSAAGGAVLGQQVVDLIQRHGVGQWL
ncbi:HNH endonuclease [Pseudomonas sp. QL9]|uniref:HNH endonuclease n=1 Tax=Pseudomonas sp. QL9 TaxID=3242725 RepID=UPI00352AEA5D